MKIVYTPSERDINIKGVFCPECGERIRGIGVSESTKIENLEVRCKRCRKYKKVSVYRDEKASEISNISP